MADIIQMEATQPLLLPLHGGMQTFDKTVEGRCITLDMQLSNTTGHVKQKFLDKCLVGLAGLFANSC